VLGVPWAFDLSVGGGSVAGYTEWDDTVSSSVLAFQSLLPNGKSAVLLINTSTSTPAQPTFNSSLSGQLKVVRYQAGHQNSFGTKTTTWSSPPQ
jgi:hypothetical protein